MAVSSVSGEAAVLAANGSSVEVSYSTDYGLTWRKVGGDLGPLMQRDQGPIPLFWSHASPTAAGNVLVVAQAAPGGSWNVWRADMSAAAPAFAKEPSDPFGAGSTIAFADSLAGSFVGRVSAAGSLSFAPLTAGGPIAFGSAEATGLPTPPRMLRLGGAREASAPPDGALAVGGGGPFVAQMLTKNAGAASFVGGSSSAATTLPAGDCELGRGSPHASVAPTATGATGLGNVALCWVRKNGTDPLTFPPPEPATSIPSTSDVAYDAAWGRGNFIAFIATHEGPAKFARLDQNGIPVYQFQDVARPGPGGDSGGVAVQGITSPQVIDTAYGPAGSSELAVALFHVSPASKDGGKTMTEVVPRGPISNAVQWWRGASGEWLVLGQSHGCDCANVLSALLNWDGASKLTSANVSGSRCADLGGSGMGNCGVLSLQAVPGTDTVFIGLTPAGPPGASSYRNSLYRATLVPGEPPSASLTGSFNFESTLGATTPPTTLYPPRAMAYCPSSAAYPDPGGTLFVATGADSYPGQPGPVGSLLRITGATTDTPSVSVVASIPHDAPGTLLNDVRADCASGVVYSGSGSGVLYKSTDGGLTFTAVLGSPDGPGLRPITAVGLNAAASCPPGIPACDVTVAATGAGTMLHSSDGGATWTIVNDPAVSRPAMVSDIEFAPPAPAGPAAARRAAVSFGSVAGAPAPSALVGTSSGAFRGDLSAASGVIGLTGASSGLAPTGVQITSLGSDDHPSLAAAPASGAAAAVFRRSDGLYSTFGVGEGSWAIPTPIPGTTGRDDFPALTGDTAGRLQLAFARTGRAPGIYLATREASGAWSAPRRISAKAGDTLPAIAAGGKRFGVAFLRARGRARGVYYAAGRGGRIASARRVPGTAAADAKPALGGPALAFRSGRPELVFARAGRRAGIYHATLRRSRWSAPRRLTKVRGDSQPTLALGPRDLKHVVFRRLRGRGRGLVALRGTRKWSLSGIPGTLPADTEPALSLSGATLLLAFARPSGASPGVYFDRRGRSGRWLAKPVRLSGAATDRNPALRAGARGSLTIVFERG